MQKNVSVRECLSFIKNYPGAVFPGIIGLDVIEQKVDYEKLPVEKWILGLDNFCNLDEYAFGKHYVPYLHKYSPEHTSRFFTALSKDQNLPRNCCFVIFCD